MSESLSAKPSSAPRTVAEVGASTLDRIRSFRVVYLAILIFLALYFKSIDWMEILLQGHFEQEVERALVVNPAEAPIIPQIQERIRDLLRTSAWIRLGEVRVSIHVFGADGVTPLYLEGRTIPPPPSFDPLASLREAVRLLPASSSIEVNLPPTSFLSMGILVGYGTVLVTGLFFYNRTVARRENARLEEAVAARDASARRTQSIEAELARIRGRLDKVEPAERHQAEEVRALQREREALLRKLDDLSEREREQRQSAARTMELEQERQALEELLEEAGEDLGHKEEEIRSLQSRLKSASKSSGSGRSRGAEQLARRMRTLYRNIEIDDRALTDLVALRDETMKLKAEEGIKRLAEESELTATRRKVGGLPPALSIFELGFAGKGRIYYTRGRQQRHRILLIGAKNTQKTDLEYLSRLA